MSEYLEELKHLRDSKTPIGETANVETNVSFKKAIDYIEELEEKEIVDSKKLQNLNKINQELTDIIAKACDQYRGVISKYSPGMHDISSAIGIMVDRIKQLENALMSLIELKAHKDNEGKDHYYIKYRQEAWKKARKLFNI